eukprot:TRINITY_DN7789_c0_g1_i1.p1 TRINITY_DN7789_c0_g1~~TRINITY_DN7789_c0_g1_i1.p1  ORF type:complete len:444 (-),score=66.81 TRINITY_DN7789_c0_g1_i1:31-1326(-)
MANKRRLDSTHEYWLHKDNSLSGGSFNTFDALKIKDEQPRKIHVFLPEEYDTKTNNSYPVIYCNDGHTAFWPPQGHHSWSMHRTIDQLVYQQKIKPVILVAIHPNNREKEYTYANWELLHDYGGVKNYSQYVATVLKPFIDQHYRTLSDTSNTVIVGGSLGGLASLYTGLSHPSVFGVIGAFSPCLWAGIDDLYSFHPVVAPLRSSNFISTFRRTLKDPKKVKIWIDWGLNREGGKHNALLEEAVTVRSKELVNLLTTQYGYKVNRTIFTHEDKIGGHDELAWGYRFSLFVERFFSINPIEEPEEPEEQLTDKLDNLSLSQSEPEKAEKQNPTKSSTVKSSQEDSNSASASASAVTNACASDNSSANGSAPKNSTQQETQSISESANTSANVSTQKNIEKSVTQPKATPPSTQANGVSHEKGDKKKVAVSK